MSLRSFLAVVLVASACSSPTSREDCTNGKDDDGNGKVDCDDPDCKGTTFCIEDAGFWGTCAKCGQVCSKQSDCLSGNVLDQRPIPQCTVKCGLLNESVQLRIEYNTRDWGGVDSSLLGAITTRWISKKGLDGGAVSCATVIAAAPSATSASQLETNGAFQLLGFDSTKVMPTSASVPMPLTIPYVYTGSGSNYLLYTEAWSGGIDSTTRLPTGNRKGKSCVESGADVAEVTTANDCSADGGTCRTLKPLLPAPCVLPDAGC